VEGLESDQVRPPLEGDEEIVGCQSASYVEEARGCPKSMANA